MRKSLTVLSLAAGLAAAASGAHAQALDAAGLQAIDAAVSAVAPKMVQWRRDIHAHPELSGLDVMSVVLV